MNRHPRLIASLVGLVCAFVLADVSPGQARPAFGRVVRAIGGGANEVAE